MTTQPGPTPRAPKMPRRSLLEAGPTTNVVGADERWQRVQREREVFPK
jgi:hypothetical protein